MSGNAPNDDLGEQLLALHQRLWSLMNALLVSPRANTSSPPSPTGTSPSTVLSEIRANENAIDTLWARQITQNDPRQRDRYVVTKAETEAMKSRVREAYVSYTTEIFADELDTLRQDPSFCGTDDDVRSMVAMLEEGSEWLWAHEKATDAVDEQALRVYDEFFSKSEAKKDEHDESIHVRRHRLQEEALKGLQVSDIHKEKPGGNVERGTGSTRRILSAKTVQKRRKTLAGRGCT